MQLKNSDRIMVPAIVALSILVPLFIVIAMMMPEQKIIESQLGSFPFFHAVLNFTTTILLIIGYYFIKAGQRKMHRNTMIAAFVLSSVFLVSYLISKMSHPSVPFGGEGGIRYIYYFILITHIVLSAGIIPLVLFTIYRGLTGEFNKHSKIAKWTLPIWLYVSITGVLVYVFMAPYY